MKDEPVIALLRRQDARLEAFRSELRAIAVELEQDRTIAGRTITTVCDRLWRIDPNDQTHTLRQLLTRRYGRNMTRKSECWRLLRVWLERQGFDDLDDGDGRPRCAECGALLRSDHP